MERILYFDCFSGISGDMTIAALIDLGLDPEAVVKEIKKLGVAGYDIEVEKTARFAIGGTDVNVVLHQPDHHHGEEDHEQHDHEHSHDHHHGHQERNLSDIVHIIENSDIAESAKTLAIKIFTEIAQAEAAVHQKSIHEVHFHEVGAIDSIVDIVGAAICIGMLKVDKIYCSPVHEGRGFVNCKHGRLPIPVPAVVEMLKGSGIPMITEDIQAELVTPTGFAILKSIVHGCRPMPQLLVEQVGYGFGKTDTGSLNALRVFLGTQKGDAIGEKAERPFANEQECQPANIEESSLSGIQQDTVTIMETNLDDTTGEILGYTMERLFEAGALDVFYTPIQMKKNRPAVMLSVICKEEQTEKLAQIIFAETSTIGIRLRQTRRLILDRELKTLKTAVGDIRVKSYGVSGLERVQPEYEDCAKAARENNLSLQEVYEIVKRRPE